MQWKDINPWCWHYCFRGCAKVETMRRQGQVTKLGCKGCRLEESLQAVGGLKRCLGRFLSLCLESWEEPTWSVWLQSSPFWSSSCSASILPCSPLYLVSWSQTLEASLECILWWFLCDRGWDTKQAHRPHSHGSLQSSWVGSVRMLVSSVWQESLGCASICRRPISCSWSFTILSQERQKSKALLTRYWKGAASRKANFCLCVVGWSLQRTRSLAKLAMLLWECRNMQMDIQLDQCKVTCATRFQCWEIVLSVQSLTRYLVEIGVWPMCMPMPVLSLAQKLGLVGFWSTTMASAFRALAYGCLRRLSTCWIL